MADDSIAAMVSARTDALMDEIKEKLKDQKFRDEIIASMPETIPFRPMPETIADRPLDEIEREIELGRLLATAAMHDPYGLIADVKHSVLADVTTRKAVERENLKRVRLGRDTPGAKAAREVKKKEELDLLVGDVDIAVALSGFKRHRGGNKALDQIWPYLSEEAQRKSRRKLIEAIGIALVRSQKEAIRKGKLRHSL